jgi:hypothetical protein
MHPTGADDKGRLIKIASKIYRPTRHRAKRMIFVVIGLETAALKLEVCDTLAPPA